MQIRVENFALLGNVLKQAKNIYIVAKEADKDSLAAGLFLEEILSDLGKKVLVVAPGNVPESLRYFAGKVTKSIPAKKLVVSFNWRENEIEKVAYNLEGENFNFVINPRNKKINPESVNIYNVGDDPDLIITLGLRSLAEISGIEPEVIRGKTVVNIDKSSSNPSFGSLNFVYPDADSFSAVVAQIASKVNLPVKDKSLALLMLGMKAATNNFEKVSDPATFEAAAFCTKMIGNKDQKMENSGRKPPANGSSQPEESYQAKQITN